MDVIKPLTALGLMSGTSMDGVDAALLVTDGIDIFKFGSALNRPYDMDMRAQLRSVIGRPVDGQDEEIKEVEQKITLFHAHVVSELLDLAGLTNKDIDIIGFHGHTVFHKPDEKISVQIGDGDLLAKQTQIPVVNRFRNSDIANGGQGGPMMASYHAALARDMEKPLVILNIGGVAKLTWIGENGELLACDTGPGNALIDDWMMKKNGTNMDFDGSMAASGTVNEKIISSIMKEPYFQKKPPKSLDRNEFSEKISEQLAGENVADGAATLTAFTAQAVACAANDFLPKPAKHWIVYGGGAHNPTLIRMLRQRINAEILNANDVHWNADFLEAQGYAFLAVRSLFGLPISFPSTTGVSHSMCGGMLHTVPDRLKKKKSDW